MKKLVSSDVFENSSNTADFDAAIPSAVVVSGTWNYSVAVEALGENLGVADLPSFEVDGQSYHIGSYSGNKLLGVKPQADATRAAVLHKLAQYLTGETAQEERCVEFGWGPSNKAVQGKECVTSNPALAALGQQNNYAKPQGQIHGSWWDVAGVIGTDVKAATDEAGLKAALEKYETSLRGIFTAVQNWGLVGSFEGSNWSTNIDLTEQADGSWTLSYTLNANDEFKFRIAGNWDTALGASATIVDAAIADNFDLTGDNIKCVVGGTYNFKVVPSESKVYISQ
jgi:arabinogalactan oligomer/maltooligosaccharide transport system substrate-binding protein